MIKVIDIGVLKNSLPIALADKVGRVLLCTHVGKEFRNDR